GWCGRLTPRCSGTTRRALCSSNRVPLGKLGACHLSSRSRLASAELESVSRPDAARWHTSELVADAAPARVAMRCQWQGGWLVRPANPSLQRNDPPGLVQLQSRATR